MERNAEQVSFLSSLGFSREQVMQALAASRGDFQAAADMLLGGHGNI